MKRYTSFAVVVLLTIAVWIGLMLGGPLQSFIHVGTITTNAQASGFVQISQVTVGTAVASVHFASIPGTYTQLLLQASGRSSNASEGDDVLLKLNTDTGSNYDRQFNFSGGGSGTTVVAGRAVATPPTVIGTFSGASSTTSAPGVFSATFPGYSQTTFWKQAHSEGGWWDGSNTNLVTLWYEWRSTSAITDMVLTLNSGGNFVTGTTFTLYGEQ